MQKKDYYKNTEVQPEHIVLAMIEDKGVAKDYLEELKLLNQHFILIFAPHNRIN